MLLTMWICRVSLVVLLFSLATSDSDNLDGFPSITNVTALAIHLYDDMQPQLNSHIFYPQLKFKCSGNITRITFIGERRIPPMNKKYLRFSVWSTKTEDIDFHLKNVNKHTLDFDLNSSRILVNGPGGSSIYHVILGENKTLSFEDGDVFGIRQSDSNRSKVGLFHQIGGGHSYQIEVESSNFHNKMFSTSSLKETNIYPLVAIETDQNSSCTEGFLNEQTLEKIVWSPLRNDSTPIFEDLNYTQSSRLHIIPNMTVTTSSGLLTKWTFAARFNHDGEEEWPELQIWRKSSEAVKRYTKISGTSMKPKATGYLNVYEYDLSKSPIEVKAGDVLGVYQPDLKDAQYILGFLAAGNDINAPTNYIFHGVEMSMQDFNIVDKNEEQSLLPLVFAQMQVNEGAGGVRGFQIPTPQEVVNKATIVPYDRLIDLTSTLQDSYLLFPFMNFTCNGTITSLMFIAKLSNHLQWATWSMGNFDTTSLSTWPQLFLWNNRSNETHTIWPSQLNRLHLVQTIRTEVMYAGTGYQIRRFEVILESGVSFRDGDVLGLRRSMRQHSTGGSSSQGSVHDAVNPNQAILTVLGQRRGYGLTLNCAEGGGCTEPSQVSRERHQQMLYIAIETVLPEQQCTVGFLNEQSLQNLVIVNSAFVPLYYPQFFQQAMSMPFTQSGPLKKIIIAAEFDVTMSSGWPEVQIIRNATNVFNTSSTEPKPTGYLNVYEYTLVATNLVIKASDVLNIAWHGDAQHLEQIRFSLAYYNNIIDGTLPTQIPMVSIIVGDCDSETDLLILNSLYCASDENTEIDPPTSDVNVDITSMTGAIIGGVVSCCFLLIAFLIVVATIVYILRQRRKKASVDPTDAVLTDSEARHAGTMEYIELDTNQAYITHCEAQQQQGAGTMEYMDVVQNTYQADITTTVLTAPNVAYGTHPPQMHGYDYVDLNSALS